MNQPTKLRHYVTLAAFLTMSLSLVGCTSPRCPEIRGKVVDANTLQPIKGAVVQFCEPPHHTIYTDADGYFLMKAAKNFHWLVGADSSGYPPPKDRGICISHKNYISGFFSPGYADPLNIRLTPKP